MIIVHSELVYYLGYYLGVHDFPPGYDRVFKLLYMRPFSI